MRTDKKDNLIAAGFQVGTAQEFLSLSDEEMRDIENRIQENKPRTKLGKKLKESHDLNHGILLDAESLLNDQESDIILSND